MGAAANLERMPRHLPHAIRREMARRFGYVEARGGGRWAVRFELAGRIHRIASFEMTGSRKRHAIRSREQAEEILEEIRSDIRRGVEPLAAVAPYLPTSDLLSVGHLWGEFCRVQRARLDAGQLSRRRVEELEGHLSRGHLDPVRGVAVTAVEYAHLEELQLALFDRGLAPKSVHHILADARTFLRWCVRRGLIHAAPEIPVTQLDEYEPTIPSLDEQRRRLAAIPEAARGYFLARGLLGIRHQEALRLEVGHYRRGPDGRDEVSIQGKGRRFRVLPVPSELASWVRAHHPPLAEAGTPLFTNPTTGGPWTQSSLIRVWRAMEQALGLPHVKPNESLRHCFATRKAEQLIAGGMTREQAETALMPILGHTSRATTQRYVKLAAETLRSVVE